MGNTVGPTDSRSLETARLVVCYLARRCYRRRPYCHPDRIPRRPRFRAACCLGTRSPSRTRTRAVPTRLSARVIALDEVARPFYLDAAVETTVHHIADDAIVIERHVDSSRQDGFHLLHSVGRNQVGCPSDVDPGAANNRDGIVLDDGRRTIHIDTRVIPLADQLVAADDSTRIRSTTASENLSSAACSEGSGR